MRLYEQQDDHNMKAGIKKLLKRYKHKGERKMAKSKLDDHVPTYNKFRGWQR